MKFHFAMPSSLKHFCVLLLITLLSFSCEKDDSPNQETSISQPQEKGYTVKKVTLNEVKQSNLVKQAIDNIEQQLDYNKLNSTKSSKTKYQTNASTSAIATNDPIKNKDNTFTILTDEILQVSTDSTDVYTFRIETPTKPESDFENFVIHKNSDESIAYYIYRYESIGSEITALNFSREEVNSDQINIGDFEDYLPSVMMYDDANRCWVRVTIENGDLIIDTSDCRNRASGGDGEIHAAGSGTLTGYALIGGTIPHGTLFRYGNWLRTGSHVNADGYCVLNRPLFDLNGNPLLSSQGRRLYQSTLADCQNGNVPTNGNSPTDTDSSDPWGNSTNTWPNVDPLHSDSGGGGSPSNDSNTDNNTNQGDIVGVLAPSPLDLAIDEFFDKLEDDEDDCLAAGFNQFKTDITNFFEENQPVRPIGYDGPVIDSNITDFANAAIDANCSGGEVDFDDNVILSKEFKDNAKLKCVYDKLAGDNNSLFKDTVGAFIDNPNVNLVLTIGDCDRTDDACTQDKYVEETGIITIRIEDINANPLEIAQMIIHEAIHAELAKYVSEFESGIDSNNREELFSFYKFYKDLDGGDVDHVYMTINYINPMASALRQFDNNSYPIDYYKSFVWEGLTKWDVNSVLTDDLIDTYYNYRSIVVGNSEICN